MRYKKMDGSGSGDFFSVVIKEARAMQSITKAAHCITNQTLQ
jgi:hypothetical protein